MHTARVVVLGTRVTAVDRFRSTIALFFDASTINDSTMPQHHWADGLRADVDDANASEFPKRQRMWKLSC